MAHKDASPHAAEQRRLLRVALPFLLPLAPPPPRACWLRAPLHVAQLFLGRLLQLCAEA